MEIKKPSLEEILSFSKENHSKEIEEQFYNTILFYSKDDAILEGIALFLKDHNLNFKELNTFLTYKSYQRNQVLPSSIYFYAAASVIIGLISFIFWFKQDNSGKIEAINNYVFKDNSFYVAAGSLGDNRLFYDVINAYKNDELDKAILLLNEMDAIKNDSLFYLSGLVYLNQGNLDLSLKSFNKIADSSDLYQKTTYFSSIVCIQLNQQEKARENLNNLSINATDDFIKTQSKKLLLDNTIW
ncbi:MAG: hypothetical protein MH472_11290 [Bacteroidia bacterium]|nr:hypothetical protein [Bacteroidia bacterium]